MFFYEEVFRALNKAKVKYVVAGGVAVVLHGYHRLTEDLDLIVFLEERNLEKLFEALKRIDYIPKVPATRGMEFSLYKKDSSNVIDIHVKSSQQFHSFRQNRKQARIKGVVMPITLKRKKMSFKPHRHLEHWVTKTTYEHRLQWLQEANEFIRELQKNKNYPNLPKKHS